MTKQGLYLKTIFCCMSCDGNIALQEINMVKKMALETSMFEGINMEELLNSYVSEINKNGALFLKEYLNELSNVELSIEEQLNIIGLAIGTIEADDRIEYSELKYFKKIRSRLSVSDEQILARYSGKEDYLLPDINVIEDFVWDDVRFNSISLH